MQKDFDTWNESKKKLNQRSSNVYFHEREIWWCSLGLNIGFEQDGTGKNYDRPALILKVFNRNSLFVIPLTGRRRNGKFYYYLGVVDDREASLSLSQARLVDSKRLIRKIETLQSDDFHRASKKIQNLLFSKQVK